MEWGAGLMTGIGLTGYAGEEWVFGILMQRCSEISVKIFFSFCPFFIVMLLWKETAPQSDRPQSAEDF